MAGSRKAGLIGFFWSEELSGAVSRRAIKRWSLLRS
jgi:hypothetical protein